MIPLPISATFSGISRLFKLEHSEKALPSIDITELGISIFFRFLHAPKAEYPIEAS